MTAHRVGKIRRDALFVADHWPDLHDARIPGTRRPWSQTRTRAESRQRAADPDDHYAKAVLGLAATPAPAHVDVLDTLVDVAAVAHTLAAQVARLVDADPLPPPSSVYGDPRPYLTFTLGHLEQAYLADGGATLVDDALDGKTPTSITRARARTAAALRLILGGQVLDADCPWCEARPLRIRIVADEPLVVCESRRVCEPPEADCGTWVKGRPGWIQPEWMWLAGRIRHADDLVAV